MSHDKATWKFEDSEKGTLCKIHHLQNFFYRHIIIYSQYLDCLQYLLCKCIHFNVCVEVVTVKVFICNILGKYFDYRKCPKLYSLVYTLPELKISGSEWLKLAGLSSLSK